MDGFSSSLELEQEDVTQLFQPIKLKDLPHLNHYISNLKTFPNPLDLNPYFYITPNHLVFSHSTRFAYRSAGPRNNVFFNPSDGTMRGAVKIFNEIKQRKLNVAVVGIPKTVDNDVGIIDRSFGFQAISAAHLLDNDVVTIEAFL